MTGKFMAYVLSIITFFYILLISISLFMHMATEERINDICFDAAETISTRGFLSSEVLEYIKGNLSCYGIYELNITLEKLNEDGTLCYYFGEEQIVEKYLSKGDRMVISAVGQNPTIFEKVTGIDKNIAAVKVAVIN